jgi:hypothetical protein
MHPNKSAAPGTSYISYFNEQQAHYTSEFDKCCHPRATVEKKSDISLIVAVSISSVNDPAVTLQRMRERRFEWKPYGSAPARSNTGDPFGPIRGLSANEIDRALISMVARSTEVAPIRGRIH